MKEAARIVFYLILAVLYFLVPFDLIPDRLGRAGLLDDLIFLLIIVYIFFFKPLFEELRGRNSGKNRAQPGANNNESEATGFEDPWEVLGVRPGSDFAQVKAAYHEKVKKYHPDLVAGMGPEIQKVAREQTTRLNRAFAALKSGYFS